MNKKLIRKMQTASGGGLVYNDGKNIGRTNYNNWSKLSFVDKMKRRFNIAKHLFNESSSPIINSVGAIFGEYDPENPDLNTGEAPSPGWGKQGVTGLHKMMAKLPEAKLTLLAPLAGRSRAATIIKDKNIVEALKHRDEVYRRWASLYKQEHDPTPTTFRTNPARVRRQETDISKSNGRTLAGGKANAGGSYSSKSHTIRVTPSNKTSAKNLEDIAFHEGIHSYGLGESPSYVWKSKYLNFPEGTNPYFLDPREIATHGIQQGQNLGIKVGQTYPGREAMIKMIENRPEGLGFGGVPMLLYNNAKTNSDYRRLWSLLNGTFKQGGKINILELFKRGGQIRKMLTASGGPIQLTPEELKYLKWSKMTPELKKEYRNNRINAELQRGPNLKHFWEAFQTYIGNRDPKNPNLNVGVINVAGTPMSSLSAVSTASRAMGGPKNIFSLNKLWRMVNKRIGRSLDSEEFSDLISNSSINNIRNAAIESDNNFPIIRITELEANDFINSLRPGLKQGGKMNILEFLKNGSGIHIKPENRGKFTKYCHGKVTSECIARGKRSSDPAVRKRATFADNARHFKHRYGGLILKHLLGNIIGQNPMATLKAFDKLWNIGLYTKDYIAQKFFGKKKSGFMDLSNKKVSRINKDTKNIESILTNDFVERKNNSYRKRKDFENTTDTIIGDRKIPLSKISTFYGIENGKLKAGPLDIFNLETIVVPNRAKNIGRIKYIHPGERIVNEGAQQDSVLAEWRRYNQLHGYTPSFWLKITGRIKPSTTAYSNMDKNNFRNLNRQFREKYHDLPGFEITYKNDYAITENGDTIKGIQKYLNAKPKIMFANEKGNGIFVSNLKNNLNKVNEYLSKHPSYPIMVDNGRNANYITNNANINRYVGPLNSNNMYILGTIYKRGGILRFLLEGGKNDSPAKTSWIKKAWGNLKDTAKEALPGLATDLVKVGINKILGEGNNSSNEQLNLSPMETFRNLATAENNYAEMQLAMNPIFNSSNYGETININPDLMDHWNWELRSRNYINKENSRILLEKILEAQRIQEEGSTLSKNLSTLFGKGIDLLPSLIGKKSKISIPTSGGLSNNNTTYTSAATGITASVDDWKKAIQG